MLPFIMGEGEENALPPTRNLPVTKLDHLIITTPELRNSFETLAIWRSQMGLRSTVVTLDQITTPGDDEAESLFNYITQVHRSQSGPLQYVLLGGDSELIPTRYLHANASKFGLDDEYLSDVYYSSPGLDWDYDNDGIYGEREDIEAIGVENISFPIKVGRVPVKTEEEAVRFVTRTTIYETDPPEGDWFGKGIISSSVMDTPNRFDDPGTPQDEGYNAYKDNGYKAVENYTMAYIPRSLDITQIHDYTEYEGGKYSGENDTLKADTLPSLISNGSAFFTFAGQSFYDVEYPVSPALAYSLAHWFDDTGTATPPSLGFQPALSYADNWNLTNGNMLPVVYISSCDSANFSDPDGLDLSNMLYAPNGGAICFIGSTGISWRGEGVDYSLGNWYLMSRFFQNYMSNNRPGDSLFTLKEQYLEQKWDEIASKEPILVGLYTYNFLGDPALRSWIGQPRELNVQAGEETIFAGGDTFEITVRDPLGTPIAGASVAITSSLTAHVFTAVTGPDGKAEVWTEFTAGASGKVTVTNRNTIPHIMNITILDQPANLMVDPASLSFSPNRPSEGKPLNITGTVKNIGGKDLTDVTVSLFSGEITDITDLPESIETIVVDIPIDGSADIQFEVLPLRSWEKVWIVAHPILDEIQFEDNIAVLDVPVNARPRFFPTQYYELEEDDPGPVLFNLSKNVFDPDDDPLTFSLEEGAPNWIELTSNGTLIVIPPRNWTGIMTLDVKVSDGLAFDETQIDIFVTPVNDAPALVEIQPHYDAVVDSPFTLRIDIFDAEGDEVDVQLISDDLQLSFIGNLIRFVPYPEDIGAHEVELVITDVLGANRSYTFTIEVSEPSQKLYFTQPSVHLPTAYVGKSYSHTIGIDGDLADGAEFSVNSSLVTIDQATGEITFKPTSDDIGEHWIKVTVTNGNVTITKSFILEIEEEKGIPNAVFWALGIGIVLLIAIIIGLYLWSGPSVEQYGLEE
jgi:hypothetical protein